MKIREELKKLISTGSFRKRQLVLIDESSRVYTLSLSYLSGTLNLEGVYITPTGQCGFTNLIDVMKEIGVNHLIVSKVVNARLAEHLARKGWELKASKEGNWIEFHLHL